jgi:hypothetical protein
VYRKRAFAESALTAGHYLTSVHFRKCLQNDELMEYAFSRSNEFHFATASIVSKTGFYTAPILHKHVVCCVLSCVAIQRFS